MITDAKLIELIHRIANKGVTNSNGAVLDAAMVTGYVVKVHDDESDELFGTIDVQEYNVESTDNEDQGLHEGVHLAAIQDISNGFLIIPRLYSDVTISKDSVTSQEYVAMFSQVDFYRIESGDTVQMGVIEREEYDPNGSDDIEAKAETGNKTWTEYKAGSIVTEVVDKDGNKVTSEVTPKDVTVKVGEDVTIKADQKNVDVTVGETVFHMEDGKVTVTTTDVTIDAEGNVTVNAKGNAEVNAKGNADINADGSCTIKTPKAQITGGQLTVNGTAAPTGSGGFCGIPACPFSGAPHIGNMISGT